MDKKLRNESKQPEITRREMGAGVLATGAVKIVGISTGEAQAQSHEHPLDLLRQITNRPTAEWLEQSQALQYESDMNVITAGGEIQQFYGIKRSDVEKLPSTHPSPDIYADLQYRDADGIMRSCCHGNDCRPAIIEPIGSEGFAIGTNFFGHILFFKILPSQVQILSADGIRPINPEFHEYKTHTCVIGGTPRCLVLPPQG